MSVCLADIKSAYQLISKNLKTTPLVHSNYLSRRIGARVSLKLENLQRTGSFKVRGAMNKIYSLTANERIKGIIAASAGNHAQGVAFNAQALNIESQIVMPEGSSLNKIAATRKYGSKVHLHGTCYQDSYERAVDIQKENDLVFIHPYDDPKIIAGQGTIGLEILEQAKDLTHIIVPVGGGGLIAGLACAVKEVNPKVKVIGAQVGRVPSLADGMAVKNPGTGEHVEVLIDKYVDEIFTIEEEEIAEAILLLMERCKTVVEGAGATPLSCLMHHLKVSGDMNIALILSGGNIDVNMISRIINRGLVKSGRLLNIKVQLPDKPGALSKLTSTLAQLKANVFQVEHDRSDLNVPLGKAEVILSLETRGHDSIKEIQSALESEAYATKIL